MRLTENTKIRIKVPKSLYEAIQAELDMKKEIKTTVSGKKEDLLKFYLKAKEINDAETDPESSVEQAMDDLGIEKMMEAKKDSDSKKKDNIKSDYKKIKGELLELDIEIYRVEEEIDELDAEGEDTTELSDELEILEDRKDKLIDKLEKIKAKM
jgi:hypothetical protein